MTLWHRRLDGVTETLRLRDPVKARCQSRKALECGLQVHLHASISIYISISHSSTDPPARHTRLSSFSSRWWLQQLGGRQQRGQLIGMTANLRVVAAVLARPPLSRTEASALSTSYVIVQKLTCIVHRAKTKEKNRKGKKERRERKERKEKRKEGGKRLSAEGAKGWACAGRAQHPRQRPSLCAAGKNECEKGVTRAFV